MLSATSASCSPWRTSTRRSRGSADAAQRSSATWSSTETCTGCATSAGPKEFSSGLLKNSGSRRPGRRLAERQGRSANVPRSAPLDLNRNPGGRQSMDHDVVTRSVGAQPLAAVRRRVLIGNVGKAWKPALDLVWEFLRRNEGLRTDGHNCFLYHPPARGEAEMIVDFGVQVIRPFQGAGEVVCTETPAGEVAMTTHVGSYSRLAAAHDAISSWRATTGCAFGPCSWEIYGDWTADEAKLETQVVYLLR